MKKVFIIILMLILAPVIILLTFIPVSLNGPVNGKDPETLLIIAHRGASGLAPENTLPAIDSALAAGADYIEIDVQLSKDQQVIVMHDETVDRTTNGSGRVSRLNFAEIQELDAGSWFTDEFTGAKVPSLGEVIRHVDGRAKLLIEIKKKRGSNEGIEEEVIALIREYNAASWCEVQSFNDKVLEIIHANAPEIALHKLVVLKYRFIPYVFDGHITRFSIEKYSFVKSVNMHYRFFNKSFSEQLHDKGKMIFLWGCRSDKPCFPMDMGDYEGIITDFPREFISFFSLNKK